MLNKLTFGLITAVVFSVALLLTSCGHKNGPSAEKVGDNIEETAEQAGDNLEEAAEDAEDAVDEAAEEVEDEIDDAT